MLKHNLRATDLPPRFPTAVLERDGDEKSEPFLFAFLGES
jgi:hypothetical protein